MPGPDKIPLDGVPKLYAYFASQEAIRRRLDQEFEVLAKFPGPTGPPAVSKGDGCTGPPGPFGPNDSGYINELVRRAAGLLTRATELYCQGHYPHSNARDIPAEHGLCRALAALADVDSNTACFANRTPEPALFEPCRPTEADKHRWDQYQGEPGLPPSELSLDDLADRDWPYVPTDARETAIAWPRNLPWPRK